MSKQKMVFEQKRLQKSAIGLSCRNCMVATQSNELCCAHVLELFVSCQVAGLTSDNPLPQTNREVNVWLTEKQQTSEQTNRKGRRCKTIGHPKRTK